MLNPIFWCKTLDFNPCIIGNILQKYQSSENMSGHFDSLYVLLEQSDLVIHCWLMLVCPSIEDLHAKQVMINSLRQTKMSKKVDIPYKLYGRFMFNAQLSQI